MLKMFISISMLMISIIMIFMNHPLSIGLMILIQTLLMCLISGMLIKTYWFSYILFLTFLGGLLVLFIYVSSIASNEMFNLTINIKMILFTFLTIILLNQIYLYMNENIFWMNMSNNLSNTDSFQFMYFFNNDNTINLNKMYNNHNYIMMMLLIIYLFVCLVAVIKITNIFYGPLRSLN